MDGGFNNLPAQARAMIVRITNALVAEGYRHDNALLIAIGQAEEWLSASDHAGMNYHVTPHPLGWVVRQPDAANPCMVFATRAEAIQVGQALAEDVNATLVIHKASGEVHSRFVYQ